MGPFPTHTVRFPSSSTGVGTAVLVSPSAFKEMKLSEFSDLEDSEMAPWNRNAYSFINRNYHRLQKIPRISSLSF